MSNQKLNLRNLKHNKNQDRTTMYMKIQDR